MRKPFLVLALCGVLLAGCSGGGRSAVDANEAITVGFSQVGAESEWRTANTRSVKEALAVPEFRLRFSDAQQKQENQIKALRGFIAQRVDVIAFSPVVESGWETVLREAKAAGIPVVLTDRAVNVSDASLYATLIGSDFVEEGRRAARWLVEDSEGRPEPVRIVELQGTVGSAPANDRMRGFKEAIEDDDRFKVVRSQSGDFTRAKGKEVMEAFLKAEGRNIDVLFAHNDDMAIGAIQAIEEAGLKPGTDIRIVSIDGVRGAFEAMKAGKLNATVECNPLLGPQLAQLVRDVHAGRAVPRRVTVDEGVFTRDQAAAELPNRKY
ncbi:LacI family transcriptional regulator [Pseudoxanthomonas broegbernensis]|uniref:LacI family transcriptional regulator n=1 Tax=Pseudoxanthomonas broegbernensis TaxID=83619 RepID=A0A7V8K6W9_9GAMM|nr:ABC transporter substrate-binding protein [Pseudoxanthomonas broegbernensis]KAF1686171.1 LacI family transcriptional regulator [Pseudoxanthomonas broegbernensis]MBB6063877.1 simple sugar transport system substrate-binding protein [Pseudoxanthomonas broegbernensis]